MNARRLTHTIVMSSTARVLPAQSVGSGLRRTALVAVSSLCVLFGVLALSAGSASAADTHLFEKGFGPDGTSGTAFTEPAGLAVDQSTGELYVADAGEGTVQKFNSAHEPVAFTDIAADIVAGKLTGLGQAGVISVSSTDHDLYAIVEEGTSLRAFQSDGEPAEFTAGPGAGTNEIGGFTGLKGLAVDGNGDIYTITNSGSGGAVYAPNGALLTTIPGALGRTIAVDSEGTVYTGTFEGLVEELTPSEFPVTSATTYAAGVLTNTGTLLANLAIDPSTNALYVDELDRVSQYDAAGVRVGDFAAEGAGSLTNSHGLAINAATGAVYASDVEGNRQVNMFGPTIVIPDVTATAASEIGPTSATLNGSVGPDAVQLTDCHFDYGATTAYGQTAPCEPAAGGIPADSSEHAVTAKLHGLQPGVIYHYRLQAENANKTPSLGADATFATPPPPAIDGATATNVTVEAADLNAKIDPGSTDPGAATTYHFEYGTSLSYGTIVPQPGATIAPGVVDVAVTRHIESLKANRTYHWRVVATNASGTTYSADHTFIYDESGSGVLPDGRAYEMVTPPAKNGALIGDAIFSPPPAISADGSHLILGTLQCFGDVSSCEGVRTHIGSPYLFTRTSAGWAAESLAPPASEFEGNIWEPLYNAETGMALFNAPPTPDSEEDFYVRGSDGSFTDVGPFSPPTNGPVSQEALSASFGDGMVATADLSHIVYTSTGLWPAKPYEEKRISLLEYSGSGNQEPRLVGVRGGPGSNELISTCETHLGAAPSAKDSDTLSSDGSIVLFTAASCPSGGPPVNEVYARVDNSGPSAHTLAISEPQALPGPPNENCTSTECRENTAVANQTTRWRDAQYSGSSADGTRTFFESTQQLTDEGSQDPNAADTANGDCSSTTGANGCNLYLYDMSAPVGKQLVTVSAGARSSGGPQVQGVLAISADGSHAYFVAKGVLAPANKEGNSPRPGEDNLYVYEQQDAEHPTGRVAFVTTLSPADAASWQSKPGEPANVTPEGRFLVFTSAGRLTADDSRSDGAQEVFRYDAATEELARISIGELGFNDNGNAGAGDASIVPGIHGFQAAGVGRRDPTMSEDGSFVFFMSPVALVPGALSSVRIGSRENGEPEYAENVYEYHEDQVYLISDGRDTSEEPSEVCGGVSATCLIGSDATGSNVFFATADQLVPRDTDTQVDVYDARVCTPSSPCLSSAASVPAGCLGEGCHGTPPAASPRLAPGSASFDGAGNFSPASTPAVKVKRLTRAEKLAASLKVCRSERKRSKRRACEAMAGKKFGAKRASRTPRRKICRSLCS